MDILNYNFDASGAYADEYKHILRHYHRTSKYYLQTHFGLQERMLNSFVQRRRPTEPLDTGTVK
jgi:hypothetical protein